MKPTPNYFLVSLSNRTNLDLCIRHGLAGFTNSANGLWTYLEIDEGDFISFLYGAQAWNLYRVSSKVALANAQNLPPWPSVTFRRWNRTYYFPFRLTLEPVRSMKESLVRQEFAYVAENLLLRGGYSKTHFQADQTTLQSASQLGSLYSDDVELLPTGGTPFTPSITFNRSAANPPLTYQFSEMVLQALIKKHLRDNVNMASFLFSAGLSDLAARQMEVLGERALAEGYVDILIKEATPLGLSNQVAVEVKLRGASITDIDQLCHYKEVMGEECRAAMLVAQTASSRVKDYASEKGVCLFLYGLDTLTDQSLFTFYDLWSGFSLSPV